MKARLIKLSLTMHVLLSYIIPKKRNYYVFLPIHDKLKLSGNIKALLLYLNENETKIKKALVSSNSALKSELNKQKIKTIFKYFDVYWALLRAEHIITDSVSFWYLEKGNFSVVQLWHGTGFKNIALLDDNVSEALKCKLKNIYSKYNIIVANSVDDKERKEKSFGSKNVIITGTPRNDVFFENDSFFFEIKKKYDLAKYHKIITYVPTFRDFETNAPFTIHFWKRLQKYLESENCLFAVKKHPLDKHLNIPEGFSNIKDLTTKASDVQELLLITDLLITDYSGIVTDFVITGKPVLIYAYDFDAYLKTCRSFYYNLEEILPKPFIKYEEELLEKILDESWFKETKVIESYNNFRSKFHQYLDGNSSKRVLEEIKKL